MVDPSTFSNREIVDRIVELLGRIDDDSALSGCVELLDHALPSGDQPSWTKADLLAFVLELAGLLARASMGGSIDEVEPAGADDGEYEYYQGQAAHRRHEGPRIDFVGAVNMVRVPLPERQDDEHEIATKIGKVRAGDHGVFDRGVIESVFSVEAIEATHKARWPESKLLAHTVELYTGGRVDHLPFGLVDSRFTPVSLFIARDRAGRAIWFVVQSSFFNGKPGRLYAAETMDHEIHIAAGFKPTPFADPHHAYRIWLTMANDRPERLIGEMSYAKPDLRYLRVELDYVRLPGPPRSNSPLRAQVVAFSRVCAIENWMGGRHFREISLEMLLHELGLRLGKLLPWFEQK
jgi:hypothetical protein